jgi:hypothetical protein
VQDLTGERRLGVSRQACCPRPKRWRPLPADRRAPGRNREGVNTQIETNVTLINTYAKQIAELNDQIGKLRPIEQRQPNDLLDQRDQLVMELNKHVKATVTAATTMR